MRKFFLIPLMTLCTCVMAFATVHTAGTYQELQDALTAAANGDEIQLTADIAYQPNGTGLINITKSITLDGQGHKLSGYGKANISVSGTENWPVTLAVNYGGAASAALDVTVKNLNIYNEAAGTRSFGLMAYDGVNKLNLIKDSISVKKVASYIDALCVTGTDETPVQLKIEDSFITTGDGTGYPAYFLKPIVGTFKNTEFKGYCSLYFKYRYTAAYGNVVGPRGSVINADACTFTTLNYHNTASNGFAVFAIEDDGITLNLHNCSGNAKQTGTQKQAMISLQYKTRTEGFQKVAVNITGDNSHYYNFQLPYFALTGWNTTDDDHPNDYIPSINVPFELNISGGTFAVNPSQIPYHTYTDGTGFNVEYAYIDPAKYEVKTINIEGAATPLYRVVPKTTTLYNLNSDVPEEEGGAGQNPNTSFELSNGTAMTLDQPTTKAGYVEVSNGTTVTVATDQTLVINNGLDVQGTSVVTAKPGSALVIGEGGIVTKSSSSIVVEANQNGAASLLLDPAITVNQTPELTVKMTVPAEHAGYEMLGSDKYRHWHRFAMPVDHMAATWVKDPDVPTYLYGWDYANQKWAQVGVTEMVPFAGYTLSPDKEISTNSAVTYTFKGKLLGNTNCTLNLNHHGYNFFGNSYTGYISILKLVDQIMGDAKIDGTVWMWNGEKYEGIGLEYLRQYGETPGLVPSWQKEVAPMQTFVLRLTGSELSSTDINYADAIWGNPRYDAAKTALNAPARRAEINDDAIIRMTIEANGQKESVVMIENSNYSDAYDRGYDAIKYMNENSFNTYVGINGENYGTVATDNLEGKMLNIKTNNELAYSITFDFVAGEEYALRDNATNQVIAIEEGATYEFAAQPNSTVEGRFEIVGRAKMPTSIENTEVKANVKGIYTIMGQYLGEDFEALPAGVYVVDGVKIVK